MREAMKKYRIVLAFVFIIIAFLNHGCKNKTQLIQDRNYIKHYIETSKFFLSFITEQPRLIDTSDLPENISKTVISYYKGYGGERYLVTFKAYVIDVYATENTVKKKLLRQKMTIGDSTTSSILGIKLDTNILLNDFHKDSILNFYFTTDNKLEIRQLERSFKKHSLVLISPANRIKKEYHTDMILPFDFKLWNSLVKVQRYKTEKTLKE
jgi:hypothetical protein